MSIERLEGVEGVLWIGDPHVRSRKKGRRLDRDFAETTVGKLESALKLAESRRLLPFILGDLFDDPDDNDAMMMFRMVRALRSSWIMPWTLLGNHEKKHFTLTDDTALAILEEAGLIGVLRESGPCLELSCNRGGDVRLVGLGGTPHGHEIPDDVSGMFDGCSEIWWATHHDMAFDGAYPGAAPVKEVQGASIVVNGHMHLTKPPIRIGDTTWYNPGNIMRMSIDTKDHVPRAWALTPWEDMLGLSLPFEREAFDMTGLNVSPLKPESVEQDDDEPARSVFVGMLKEEALSTPSAKSMDGTYVMESLKECLNEDKGLLGDDVDAVLNLLEMVRSETEKSLSSKK